MDKPESIISKEIIFNDRITRLAYSRDASMYRLFPKSVVKPRNVQDVKDLLQHARSSHTPITFRAGGTSLSGQSIGSGIVAETLHDWKKFKILDNGKSVFMQSGVNASYINRILSLNHMKLGPDPASIGSASIGGILSNNSSGMVCGTDFNSYHTLENISFMLPNGNIYKTANFDENNRFIRNEKKLAEGLVKIRKAIKDNHRLVDKIRDKYRIKNTIGYSMNAFLDFEKPIDIFSHLLIGSEGTLAFIIDATLKTIPDPPNKGTGLVLFENPEDACNSISFFKDLGASAIEFLDDASLRTAIHFENPPYDLNAIKDNCTGILIEYQDNSISEIDYLINETRTYSKINKSISSIVFAKDKQQREIIWNIRKGLYPTIGALRKEGKSLINEDIALDVENIAPAIRMLKDIFKKRNLSDGVIFGHAKDGNLHFITSVDINSTNGIKNYDLMMRDLAEMTLNEFNGSLKAEHGTGRNMAPFVETEWGGSIYNLMWDLKKLTDPFHIMNPDVLLSKDSKIHLKNIKKMPLIHSEIDSCVECGFCENICPSRGLTYTPRQRIGIMREVESLDLTKKEKEILEYGVNDTCATDGLCSLECPVNINTGIMVKDNRVSSNGDPWFVEAIANQFKFFILFFRFFIKSINIFKKILGAKMIYFLGQKINLFTKGKIPSWPKNGLTVNKNYQKKIHDIPDYYHFPSCLNRVLSGDNKNISSSEYLLKIGEIGGLKISTLKESSNLCCGMAFSSKGYKETGSKMRDDLLNQIQKNTDNFKVPIIIDMSPCAENMINGLNNSGARIIDSVSFLNDIKHRLPIEKTDQSFYAHSVCSTQKLNNSDQFKSLIQYCVEDVEFPDQEFCCGMGGDRGLKYPELPFNAIQKSITGTDSQFGVSSSRACEVGLSGILNKEFLSLEALVYKSIKK